MSKRKYIILQGDCLELMKGIPTGSVDMVLCDLPYETTSCNWDRALPLDRIWAEYDRILKPNGTAALFAAEPFASLLRLSNVKNYKYDWVWNKVKGAGFLNAKKQPLRSHEVICVFYRKQCLYNPQKTTGHKRKIATGGGYRYGGDGVGVYGKMTRADYDSTERYPKSILTFSNADQTNRLHPAQKPVALCEYLIRTYTNEGDTVLDICMGSGSTGVACMNTGRRFIGMELDPGYFEIAKKRIEEAEEKGGVYSGRNQVHHIPPADHQEELTADPHQPKDGTALHHAECQVQGV